jgi:hypothetical protein
MTRLTIPSIMKMMVGNLHNVALGGFVSLTSSNQNTTWRARRQFVPF